MHYPLRALVTGGAGFIGSHVADHLLGHGTEVIVLDDLSTGLRRNVPKDAVFVECDIRDRRAVSAAAGRFRPELVFHFAAQMDVRRSLREPALDAETNVIGTLNVLLSSLEHGVRRVVYASTGGAAYGDVSTLPASETVIPFPVSEYGASKVAAEHYFSVYHARKQLETVVLRLPNVFGPRQRPDGEAGVVAIFAGRILAGEPCIIYGDGSKTRDYVYVSDIVRGFMLAMEHGDGGVYNLGSGVGITDRAVYDAVARALQCDREPEFHPVRPGEVRHVALDGSLASRELDWVPEVPFQEGIARAVSCFKGA